MITIANQFIIIAIFISILNWAFGKEHGKFSWEKINET